MAAQGLDPSRLIAAGPPPISMREGAAAMGAPIEALPDTEAVICVSDLSVFGALTEGRRRGLAVPDRIATGGFGAYEIASICGQDLTTLNPFPQETGAQAAALIPGLRDGTRTGTVRIALEPVQTLRGGTRRATP